MDGFAPDGESARPRLVAAKEVLDAAQTALKADVPKGKQQRVARKQVKKAGKSAAALDRLIGKGKPQKKLAKRFGKGLKSTLGAIEVLDPVEQ